jgi:hypothetical protein
MSTRIAAYENGAWVREAAMAYAEKRERRSIPASQKREVA